MQTLSSVPCSPFPPIGQTPSAIQGAAGASRTAASALIRLITGHAFIGSYTARFRPPETNSLRKCGVNPQTLPMSFNTLPSLHRARAHLSPSSPRPLPLHTFWHQKRRKGHNCILRRDQSMFQTPRPPLQPRIGSGLYHCPRPLCSPVITIT